MKHIAAICLLKGFAARFEAPMDEAVSVFLGLVSALIAMVHPREATPAHTSPHAQRMKKKEEGREDTAESQNLEKSSELEPRAQHTLGGGVSTPVLVSGS